MLSVILSTVCPQTGPSILSPLYGRSHLDNHPEPWALFPLSMPLSRSFIPSALSRVSLSRPDQRGSTTTDHRPPSKKPPKTSPHSLGVSALPMAYVGLFVSDFSDSFAASLITDVVSSSFISLTHYRTSVWMGRETRFLRLYVRQRHTWPFCWTCRVAVVLAGVQLPSRVGHPVRVSFDWWLIVRL